MPRILQICNTDFYMSKFLLPLVLELQFQGYDVECLCAGKNKIKILEKLGIKVHRFEFPKNSSPLNFLLCIEKMRKLLMDNNFDCVNSHNRNASIVARIASWRANIPVNLYTAHGFYFHDNQSKFINLVTELFEGVLLKITSFTMSQSKEDMTRMINHHWVKPDKIITIGNGIDIDKFTPRMNKETACKKLNLMNKFRVVAVGRMVRGKGFHDLIRAFSVFRNGRDLEMIIVGGNLDEDIEPTLIEYRNLVSELKLENQVRITGLVDNVEDYLAASDIFVLPSYREGLPRGLLEAMCMSIPVIATDIRGAREIIKDGVNGFLYPPHDVAMLIKVLNKIFEIGVSRRRYGIEARKTVVSYFDEKEYVKKQVNIINKLLKHDSNEVRSAAF